MSQIPRLPSYRLHKPSGQAVVTIPIPGGSRRDIYLGEYNSATSRKEYARVIAELASSAAPEQVGGSVRSDMTVDEILVLFWQHAEQHYRRADGSATNELMEYRQTFKPLRALYGHTIAREFGPLALKSVRTRMIDHGLCRRLVNQRVGRIRRIFKWAASEELLPASVFQALATVTGLQKGRSSAREPEPVLPVDPDHVRATLPFLRPNVCGMIALQLLTGMRPGEVCVIRPADIDMTGELWVFRPPHHKLRYQGKARVVVIGPKAQAVLAQFQPLDPTDFYFSPRRSVEQFHAERSQARKIPRYESHMIRNIKKRTANASRRPSAKYTSGSYGRAILRAVEAANRPLIEAGVEIEFHVPHWAPNMLRHARATEVRKRFGLEAAQVVLGHQKANTTELYAERNLALAATVATQIG